MERNDEKVLQIPARSMNYELTADISVWGKSGWSDALNMKQTTLQLCNLILPPANSDFFKAQQQQ